MLDQASTPLLSACLDFIARKQAPFYSPGHKGGRTLDATLRAHVAELDLNNLPDTDTLHCPSGPIRDAEALLASAYGVDNSFMLVGGSTSGNIAALLTTIAPGERLLVQRNTHKSVIAGIIHSGALPVWLMPEYQAEFGVALGVSRTRVNDAFAAHPDAKALFALNPTYFGTTPDITALAALCRDRNKLLLVDEAHGPHFHFHPELPTAAEDVGADAVVQSSHKILSALSQAAVLHTRKARIDEASVRKVLQLLQTTSPNFAIMASIDTARRQMATEGHELLTATLKRARAAREELSRIPGIEVLGSKHLHGEGSGFANLDETKIVIRVDGVGLTGYDVQRWLNQEHGVQPELGGAEHVLFIMTIGNTDEDVSRMVTGVRAVAETHGTHGAHGKTPRARDQRNSNFPAALAARTTELPPIVVSPREAFYAPAGPCEFRKAEGRVCAEIVTPYPPGIPVLMPGERVTREVLDSLAAVREARCPISASDSSLSTLRVVL